MRSYLGGKSWCIPDLIGFGAHWVWIWCVFWSSLFYSETGSFLPEGSMLISIFVGDMLEPLWVISLAANVLTIGFLLLLTHIRNPLSSVRGFPWCAAALTTVGTLAISHLLFFLAVGRVLASIYFAGSVLTGIGSGMIVVLWAERLFSYGSQETVNYSVVSVVMAAIAYLILQVFPEDLTQIVVALMPIVSMGCFISSKKQSRLHSQLLGKVNVRIRERPPIRMIVVAIFFGLSFGAMKGLIVPVGTELIQLRDLLNILAIVIGTLAVFLTTTVYRMDFDHLTYQVALPLMAAGFLFLPLQEPWNVIGTAVHQLGYQYFYIVFWALWSALSLREGIPTGWMGCWGLFSIQFGQFVGSAVAAAVLGLIGNAFQMAMLSLFIVFFILIIALFVIGSGSTSTGWGFVQPIEENGNDTDQFEQKVSRLAHEHNLSPREEEVFLLLAKGRNRAYIRNEFLIGNETVKSHVKNIYRKLGVHSQQELIDLVEG